MDRVKKRIQIFLREKISPLAFLTSFLGIVAIRLFIDKFLTHSRAPIIEPVMDLHNLLFFLTTFLFIWSFLSLILKKNPFELAYLMVWASLLIIFPPIFDMVKTGGEVYWSFYLLSSPKELLAQFLSIFGYLPSGIVYFGTKIVFLGGILAISSLVFLKTGRIMKAALVAIGSYTIFFIMASFPSLFFFIYSLFSGKKAILDIQSVDIAQFFSSFRVFGTEVEGIKYSLAYNLNFVYFLLIVFILAIFLFFSSRARFWVVLRNFRLPQLIYHSGLLFIGLGLGYLAYPENFGLSLFSILAVLVLLASVWLAWKASVIFNDIYDFEIDKISNAWRPLQRGLFTKEEYFQFGVVCFLLSLLGGFVVGARFGVILLIYQILAWFYSAPPYRLKKIPLVATLISSLASLNVLFLGFILFSGGENIQLLSWRIIFMLLLVYTLCLPIKDFKDIVGDKKEGILTVPVIFGEDRGRIIVATNFFIAFMSSVFFLNELRLFFWALLFGIFSFLIIIDKKIKPYNLFWWALGAIFIYGLILVSVVFLP